MIKKDFFSPEEDNENKLFRFKSEKMICMQPLF